MSQKKKKNVPSVKEPKLEGVKAAEAPAPAEVLSQTPSPEPKATAPSVKALPISLEKVSADKIKMAEDLGIPVTQIVTWMGSVEERLKLIEETLPQKIQDSFKKVILEAQAQQQAGPAASSGNIGGGGGGMLQLIQMAKEAGIMGGGGSSELQDKIMSMAIESMGLGNALVKAIILKTAPELASQILPSTPKP